MDTMKRKWQLWINGPLYWIQLHIWHRNPLLAAHQVSQKRALLVSFVLLLLITAWPYTLWIFKRWQIFKGFSSREIYFTSSSKFFDGIIMFGCQSIKFYFFNLTQSILYYCCCYWITVCLTLLSLDLLKS